MDNEQLRERNISQTGGNGANWSAEDSLRRNAGLNKVADEEVTPLLGNGGRSSEDNRDTPRRDSEWDGNVDFEGLTWWHRPSVSWIRFFCDSVLMNTGLLVITTILPLCHCFRWHTGPKAQPHPISCLPRIPHREVRPRPFLYLHPRPTRFR